MARLWLSRMLRLTALPIFVMHAGVNASAMLGVVDPGQRVRYQPVDFIHGGYWGKWAHYRLMHTKLAAWNLPCKQVAFLDYDNVPLRNFDQVFDVCGDAQFCATKDVVYPKKPGLRLPNAGMMVIRTDATKYHKLVSAAEQEARENKKRMLAEQGFLLSHFPDWKELPMAFNLPQWTESWKDGTAVLADNSSFLYHRKLLDMPHSVARLINASREWMWARRLPRACRLENITAINQQSDVARVCGNAVLHLNPRAHIEFPSSDPKYDP